MVTETWLHPNLSDSEVIPPNYRILRKDLDTEIGGVAIIHNDSLEYIRMSDILGVETLCVYINICST